MKGWRLARVTALGAALLLSLVAARTGGAKAEETPSLPEGLAGQLLVATPQMPDPRFMRTVIYMVRHNASGAMGLVLNRPMGEVPLAPLLEGTRTEPGEVKGTIRLHYGGPVERAQGFVLHTADYRGKETLLVTDAVALSWEPEVLRAIAAGTGPRRSFLALGHSGWAPGQLEAEMRAGHWVSVPADEALVFDDDYDGKWPRAMNRRRISL